MDRWMQILFVCTVVSFLVTRNIQVSFVIGGITAATDFVFISRRVF